MGTRQRTKRTTRRVVAGVLGLVTVAGVAFAGSAAADSPAADEARRQPLVPGTPCTVTAKACVDLDSQRSWLFEDGKIKQGPVGISSGGNGQETPIGHSLRVYRKDADHKSEESRLPNGQPAPMPWSTFFADGDAKAWFDYLQVGDQVQVVSAKQELAARGK